MTQEEKELLLKDLCARLPYGVRVKLNRRRETSNKLTIDWLYTYSRHVEDIKPYLRPLSSMTEEEIDEYREIQDTIICQWDDCGRFIGFTYAHSMIEYIDWLNKKMFDYRGLIPIGLGIDCTGLNIYENEKSI